VKLRPCTTASAAAAQQPGITPQIQRTARHSRELPTWNAQSEVKDNVPTLPLLLLPVTEQFM